MTLHPSRAASTAAALPGLAELPRIDGPNLVERVDLPDFYKHAGDGAVPDLGTGVAVLHVTLPGTAAGTSPCPRYGASEPSLTHLGAPRFHFEIASQPS